MATIVRLKVTKKSTSWHDHLDQVREALAADPEARAVEVKRPKGCPAFRYNRDDPELRRK